MTLEELLKIEPEERDRRLAAFMEAQPSGAQDVKPLRKWELDERCRGAASDYLLLSRGGWWELPIDFARGNDHVPQWRPRFNFTDDLADDDELNAAAIKVIDWLAVKGWLVHALAMWDGWVIGPRVSIDPLSPQRRRTNDAR